MYAAAFPFSRTALADDIVQRLPAASVIAAVEPARTTVSLGDAVGVGVGVGGLASVLDGVGVGVGTGKGLAPALHADPVHLYH